jgi:hypothetical protein
MFIGCWLFIDDLFRGCYRGSSTRLRELTSQCPGVEPRYLRSKDVVAPANIDRLQESFLPKSPNRHWRQSGLLNKFVERHWRF